MKVRDLMVSDVVTLHADSAMVDAEEIMGFRRLRHLPVVEGRRLVGLITHRDLLRHYLTPVKGQTWVEHQVHKAKVKVREVMTSKVVTIAPDADLVDAARLLEDKTAPCLLVVEANGDLVGILTEADFMKLTRVLLQHVVAGNAGLQKQIEGWLAA